MQLFRPTLNRIYLDETAHASYIVHLQKTGQWWPNLEDLPMIDKANLQITNWRKNYLNHPPFYYKALALTLPQLEKNPQYIALYRAVNIGLIVASLILLFKTASELNLSLLGFSSFCALCTFVPGLALLGATINNDNLGIFSGALMFFAAHKFLKTSSTASFALLMAATLLAAASKLTCFLFVASFVLALLAMLFLKRKLSPVYIFTAIIVLVIASLPYLGFLYAYGSPTPLTSGHLALIKDTSEQLGWANDEKMSPLFFIISFFFFLSTLWVDIPLTHILAIALAVCVFTIIVLSIFAFVKAVYKTFASSGSPQFILAAGGISLEVTLLLHMIWSYKYHVTYGYILGAYPRYYYPAIGLMAYALISFLQPMRPRYKMIGYCILILLPIVFTASSIPRFLFSDVTQ